MDSIASRCRSRLSMRRLFALLSAVVIPLCAGSRPVATRAADAGHEHGAPASAPSAASSPAPSSAPAPEGGAADAGHEHGAPASAPSAASSPAPSSAPAREGGAADAGQKHGAPASAPSASSPAGGVAAKAVPKGKAGNEGSSNGAQRPGAPGGPHHGVMTTIKSGAESIDAYLSLPGNILPHPAVIVIHEWWGLNDQIKSVADAFASKGFVAMAPDLYRGRVTDDPDTANELMRALPEARAVADLSAAYAYMGILPSVRSNPIGSIGFCMGGRLSLLLAAAQPRLAACVVCYGRPELDPQKLRRIRAPVLGIYGGADNGIPQSMVESFKKAMRAAVKTIDITVYAKAGHGFLNPNNPGYAAADAKDAWLHIDAFLAKNLLAKAKKSSLTPRIRRR